MAKLCDEIFRDPMLRRLKPKGSYAHPSYKSPAEQYCSLGVDVSSPMKGHLRVAVSGNILTPDGINSEKYIRKEYVKDSDTLEPCAKGADCWLERQECNVQKPRREDLRVEARAISYPYRFDVSVILWPNDSRGICEMETWLESQAGRLLKRGLTFLLA